MNPPRGVEWDEHNRQWSMCWLCEAWHLPGTYKFLKTIRGREQTRAAMLEGNVSDMICQECGGRLCTGPHHGTKPCHARQLATKMCRAGWVSVRRFPRGEPRRNVMSTSARVCAEILTMFNLPAHVVQSRYAGTVGAECWTNDVGRETLLFIQHAARVLRLGNPKMARAMLAKPEVVAEYRAMLNLGASAATLAKLLNAEFNQRRLAVGQIRDNIAVEDRR